MDIKAFRILSSIPINSIDSFGQPKSMASGCFVQYRKEYFFLTVYHTIEDNELSHMLVTDIDTKKGTLLFPLNLSFMKRGNIQTGIEKDFIDFAWQQFTKLPKCFYCQYNEKGELEKCLRNILPIDFNVVPNENEEYGFAGYVNGRPEENPFVNSPIKTILNRDLIYHSGLKYKGIDDDYYIFSMPNSDFDDSDFHGTSGAPIIDSKGKLVALVSRGHISMDEEEWIIKGIALSKFKFSLDMCFM